MGITPKDLIADIHAAFQCFKAYAIPGPGAQSDCWWEHRPTLNPYS